MSILNLPDVNLYYESSGNGGPLLLLIPGSNGGGDIYGELAASLAQHYQVITYDRRGYSRSKLEGSQDSLNRLADDASDVRLLIEHLSDQPVLLFGSDSGAIVALEVLKRFPEKVDLAIAHEPLLVKLLPDSARWQTFFEEVYGNYQQSGVPRAMHQYASTIGSTDHRLLMPFIREQTAERGWANASNWMEHELRQYYGLQPDIEALAPHSRHLVLAGGENSQDQLTYQPSKVLAEKLGLKILNLPGGHLGYLSDPAEFAIELQNILSQKP